MDADRVQGDSESWSLTQAQSHCRCPRVALIPLRALLGPRATASPIRRDIRQANVCVPLVAPEVSPPTPGSPGAPFNVDSTNHSRLVYSTTLNLS
ncbi:hypothetical protein J6590_026177 [Homalodisca vitripennis]|nr:hypothetical protein J6590_026177 [Homalodisca vitripennis]